MESGQRVMLKLTGATTAFQTLKRGATVCTASVYVSVGGWVAHVCFTCALLTRI